MFVYGQLKNKNEENFPWYNKIAEKMWFKEKDDKAVEYSHSSIPEVSGISLSLDRWLNHDERWIEFEKFELYREWIGSGITKIKNFNELQFITNHINILTDDRRAFYIFVIERMKQAEGLISEDDRQTWITVEEFEKRHQDILSLTYDEANEISLVEIKTMKAIKERRPDWDTEEEEKAREDFFQANKIKKSRAMEKEEQNPADFGF